MTSQSACCGAPLRPHEGEEGTQWFTCSACKRPADPAADPMRALWECLLLSGADVSGYADETRTEEGREAGFREWTRRGSTGEVVDAIRQLREDCDA